MAAGGSLVDDSETVLRLTWSPSDFGDDGSLLH